MNKRGSYLLPLAGLGTGITGRAIMQNRNIRKTDKVEDERENRIWNYAPFIGLAAGLLSSPDYWRLARKIITKTAMLKDDVKLRPHQEEAVDYIAKNRRGILAHATGLGKTLTSIASYERLKEKGKAQRALVVVPASLRDNYVDNIKRFTNSTYSIYGPVNERASKNIEDNSDSDYNIISYDLYRKDPDGIRERIGADTLIIDEVHRTRNEASETYKELSESSPKYNNVITLTGSVVNNEPADITPLIDVTYGKDNNPIGNKKLFEKLFVRKIEKTHGIFNPKSETHQSIINKQQLSKILAGKVHYLTHDAVKGEMPEKDEEMVRVPMSKEQDRLYRYTLDELDPITRVKIRYNIPISQREMSGIFGKLIRGRQVMTDPAILAENLKGKNPYEYSNKVRKVVDDLEQHLSESPGNKSVIYGNLITSQVDAVRKALDMKGIPYSTFLGTGNEGNTAKGRSKSLKEYMDGKKRVMLISSAGGEGLDLKGTSMMQMLEGHYNPERIQQAEARVRRLGDKRETPIKIKKYVSYTKPRGIAKALSWVGKKPPTSIDEYIYNVARRKDALNQDFRDVLEKKSAMTEETRRAMAPLWGAYIGSEAGGAIANLLEKREDQRIETDIRQKLQDMGRPEYVKKKHLANITRLSKIDERKVEAAVAGTLIGIGLGQTIGKTVTQTMPGKAGILPIIAITAGLTYAAKHIPRRLLGQRINNSDDIERAVEQYDINLHKKVERKLKSSADYLDEHERIKRLGLDEIMLEA